MKAFLRLVWDYVRSPDHGWVVIAVLAGGYAAGLFLWEATHASSLMGYLFGPEPVVAPRLLWLGAASLLAIPVWLAMAWLLAIASDRTVMRSLDFSGRLFLALLALPFLPLLAIPGIEDGHAFLTLGMVLATALVAYVAASQIGLTLSGDDMAARLWRRPGRGSGLLVAGVLALAYAVFMSLLTVSHHNAFQTHAFDLGIHDQAIANILRLGWMRTTLYSEHAINYIGDHFSPILYLVAPFYALRPDASTLLILQSVVLAAGAIPVYLLARHRLRSTMVAVSLAAVYLLFPALHGVNTFDFHQIALATTPLLFALYFLDTGRDRLFLVFLFLALISKEEVALTVAAIGAYVFLVQRRYRFGGLIALSGLVYFVIVVKGIMPALGGAVQLHKFAGLTGESGAGFEEIVGSLVRNPLRTFLYVAGDPSRLLYFVQVLVPLLFLPFVAGAAWIMALPAAAVPLLSSQAPLHDIAYHYSAHLIPFLFYLAITGLARLPRRPRRLPALAIALIVAGLLSSYEYGAIFAKGGAGFAMPDAHDAVLNRFIAAIPAGAAVSTLSDLAPHLTNRDSVYLFPIVSDATYLLFDGSTGANFWPATGLHARDDVIALWLLYVTNGEFGLVQAEDGVALLERGRVADPMNAVRAVLAARYEAEDMRGDAAAVDVADPGASGGRARYATPAILASEGNHALVFGPYTRIYPGRYRVTFYVKAGESAGASGTVATLDVFTHQDGYPRAVRDLSAADLSPGGGYQPLSLEFETGEVLEGRGVSSLLSRPSRSVAGSGRTHTPGHTDVIAACDG